MADERAIGVDPREKSPDFICGVLFGLIFARMMEHRSKFRKIVPTILMPDLKKLLLQEEWEFNCLDITDDWLNVEFTPKEANDGWRSRNAPSEKTH